MHKRKPGTNHAGLNRTEWGMLRRRERTPEEKERWVRHQKMPAVHHRSGMTDRDYAYYRVKPDKYTIVLTAGGLTL